MAALARVLEPLLAGGAATADAEAHVIALD